MKRITQPDKVCRNCGELFNRKRADNGRLESLTDFQARMFCKQPCYWEWMHGENHHNYVDGFRRGHDGGYIRYTNGEYVHRDVMSKKLGRPLRSIEHVHHKDEDPTNNHPDNLELTTNSLHRKHHAANQKRDSEGKFS